MRRTWALRGAAPVLRRLSKRREVSSLIAVTPCGRLSAWHIPGHANALTVIRALKHFRRTLGSPLLIVWDRANIHRDTRVRRFIAEHGEQFADHLLPPYAPDLNPEEQANAIIKARCANAVPATICELKGHAKLAVRYLQRHPHMVRNFFHHAGLSVTGVW